MKKNNVSPIDPSIKVVKNLKDHPPKPPKRPSWDQTYISMCYTIAAKSHDPRTKIGSVVVGKDMTIKTIGYNGFPRGVSARPEILESPEKYKWMIHAEVNAMSNAGRNGMSLIDASIYVNLTPCNTCAGIIIQHGITEVIVHKNGQSLYETSSGKDGSYWEESFICTKKMFREAGIKLRYVDYSPNQLDAWFNSQSFRI